MAIGNLTGTLTDATGTVTDVAEAVVVPVDLASTTASCDILHLVLGPLDLNILGLQINLSQVVLDITAERGPGNLLCAVAGLLDNTGNIGGILNGIAALLNRILRALG